MIISDEDGQTLVKVARAAVTEYLIQGKKTKLSEEIKSKFSFKAGIFVTLNKDNYLRGCIGFPMPDRILHESLVEASIAAAIEDTRFAPVVLDELDKISFEVSVLSTPIQVKTNDSTQYPKMIKVGRDGLIVKCEYGAGLLLPQVPIEYNWNEEEFLSQTCRKAGAPSDQWKKNSTSIYKFQGIVYKEIKPNGPVKKL